MSFGNYPAADLSIGSADFRSWRWKTKYFLALDCDQHKQICAKLYVRQYIDVMHREYEKKSGAITNANPKCIIDNVHVSLV